MLNRVLSSPHSSTIIMLLVAACIAFAGAIERPLI